MSDVRELLRAAAGDEPVRFGSADVRARVDRRHRRRRASWVAGVMVPAVVLLGGLWTVGTGSNQEDEQVATGGVSAEASPLAGRWVLTAFALVSPGAHEPTWLDLAPDGELRGEVDCIPFLGRWDVADGRLVVDELQAEDVEARGCGADVEPSQAEVLLDLLSDDPYVVQPSFSTGTGMVVSEQPAADVDGGAGGAWFAFSRFEDLGPVPDVEQLQGEWMHADGIVTFDADLVSVDGCPGSRWTYRNGVVEPGAEGPRCREQVAAVLDSRPDVRSGGQRSEVLYLSTPETTTALFRFELTEPSETPSEGGGDLRGGTTTDEAELLEVAVVATPNPMRVGEQLFLTTEEACVGDLTVTGSGPDGYTYDDPNQAAGPVFFSFDPGEFAAEGIYDFALSCVSDGRMVWGGSARLAIEDGPVRPEFRQGAPGHPCFLPEGPSLDCD